MRFLSTTNQPCRLIREWVASYGLKISSSRIVLNRQKTRENHHSLVKKHQNLIKWIIHCSKIKRNFQYKSNLNLYPEE
jgi:hypothetical protein